MSILYLTAYIQVADAHLVETGEALDMLPLITGNNPRDSLTSKGIDTTTCGEISIISVRITLRLPAPKFMTEYCGKIQTTFQRFKQPAMAEIFSPRNIILLNGHCYLCTGTVITGYETDHQMRLPLAMTAIVPAQA